MRKKGEEEEAEEEEEEDLEEEDEIQANVHGSRSRDSMVKPTFIKAPNLL